MHTIENTIIVISLIHMENNDGDKHSPCRRPISNGKASINPSGVLIYS